MQERAWFHLTTMTHPSCTSIMRSE